MSVINQKEYLKRYLSLGDEKEKKKKRKKKALVIKNRLKIIDDDVDVPHNLKENELNEFLTAEDAPQVVGIIDERPLALRLDDYRKSDKWKLVGSDDELKETEKPTPKFTGEKSDQLSKLKSKLLNSEKNTTVDSDVDVPRKSFAVSQKSDSDVSPPRKQNVSYRDGKSDSDISPDRSKAKDISPEIQRSNRKRRSRFDSDSDQRNREVIKSDSDARPHRKKSGKNYDSDLSPPRPQSKNTATERRKRLDSDSSPVRRKPSYENESRSRNSQKGNESSRNRYDSDSSPVRRKPKYDTDARKIERNSRKYNASRRSSSSDRFKRRERHSPPAGKTSSKSSDAFRDENERLKRRKDDRDLSPIRKKSSYETEYESRTDRRKSNYESESGNRIERSRRSSSSDRFKKRERHSSLSDKITSKFREEPETSKKSSKHRNDSDSSPVRRKPSYESESGSRPEKSRGKTDSLWRDRTYSPIGDKVTAKKIAKTLDGKTAGLQYSNALKEETAALKKRENDLFANMSEEISGRSAAPVMRDRKTGKKRDLEQEAMEEFEKQLGEKAQKEKYDKWGKGLKQVEDHKEKIEQELYEMSKPLARYADDEDLEKYLKEQEREGDPMLQYIRKKKRKEAEASGKPSDIKPMYEGEFMPNRFGIPPGHRWDGVDRSNGYEKQWFTVQNAKKAVEEEIYKWSIEDM